MLVLAKVLLGAGVPPAAIGVVFGVPDQVSSHLIESPIVSKVTFTGSVDSGKLLAAAAGRRGQRTTRTTT